MQEKLYLIKAAPEATATDKQKAAQLAEFQTQMFNISLYLSGVVAFHTTMALIGYLSASGGAEPKYGISVDLGDWLIRAYIILSVAGMGYCGAKHCDKNQTLGFVCSCALWFIYMGRENLESIMKYFNLDCDTTAGDDEVCHRQPWEKEMCQDQLCNSDAVNFDQKHPFAEMLPDFVLMVLFALGACIGYMGVFTKPFY